MADFSLAIPRIAVTLDDGTTFTVQALNPDLIAYDRTAAKHGWPEGTKAPFYWLTFLAWHAARRTDQIDKAMTWEDFSEARCVQVRNVSPDAEDVDAINLNGNGTADEIHPTQLDPVRG